MLPLELMLFATSVSNQQPFDHCSQMVSLEPATFDHWVSAIDTQQQEMKYNDESHQYKTQCQPGIELGLAAALVVKQVQDLSLTREENKDRNEQ